MQSDIFNTSFQIYFEDMRVVVPIITGLIGFIIFWFTHKSRKVKTYFLKKYGHDNGYALFVITTKCLGALSLGLFPILVYLLFFPETSLAELGLTFYFSTATLTVIWILGLAIVLIPLVYISAKKAANLKNYPQIRASVWTKKILLGNLSCWAIYLLGYELYFRGVLLFPLIDSIGLWPAIAINIGLYSATHVPKGLSETIGAIPFAIVLCLLTVMTGTIWIAFFVHLTIAWTNSIVALKNNPDMKLELS